MIWMFSLLYQAALLGGFTGSVLSAIITVVAAIIVLFLIFKLGKFVIGAVVNGILGLIAIFALNYLFALGIPITIPILVVTALFGLPAVAILSILRLFGIPL